MTASFAVVAVIAGICADCQTAPQELFREARGRKAGDSGHDPYGPCFQQLHGPRRQRGNRSLWPSFCRTTAPVRAALNQSFRVHGGQWIHCGFGAASEAAEGRENERPKRGQGAAPPRQPLTLAGILTNSGPRSRVRISDRFAFMLANRFTADSEPRVKRPKAARTSGPGAAKAQRCAVQARYQRGATAATAHSGRRSAERRPPFAAPNQSIRLHAGEWIRCGFGAASGAAEGRENERPRRGQGAALRSPGAVPARRQRGNRSLWPSFCRTTAPGARL